MLQQPGRAWTHSQGRKSATDPAVNGQEKASKQQIFVLFSFGTKRSLLYTREGKKQTQEEKNKSTLKSTLKENRAQGTLSAMNKAGRTHALYPKYPKFLLPVAGLLRSCSGWERVKNGVWQGEQSRPLLQLSVPCLGPHGLQPALQGHCFLLFLLFQVLLPGWEQMGGQDTAQGRRFLHRHSGRSFPLLHLWPHTGVSLSV